MREKLTEACRGKGSTLFLSLNGYDMLGITVCFACLNYVFSWMRRCLYSHMFVTYAIRLCECLHEHI